MKVKSLGRLLGCALAPLSFAVAAQNASLDSSHSSTQAASQSQLFQPNPLEAGGKVEQVNVAVAKLQGDLRRFTLSSSQQQRDDKEKTRTIDESPSHPRLHSNSPLFDALFSMAIDDMRQASVKAIRDDSYNNGQSIACDCFETGEKWHYVWTRDLSYAANLGLAHLDPQRVMNSMLFKVSGFRDGVKPPVELPAGSLQILQDTGSGGSWPVSTDRVTWALAVKDLLQSLQGAERAQFLDKAYAALTGTLEADRLAAFDSSAGLYGGEQSYLDWRTQTYAPWIVNNLSRLSESKALSTNVAHYQALRVGADLAREKNNPQQATKYEQWAAQLKQKINDVFWQADANLYATSTTSAQDTLAISRYDMLGNALAVIYGVASPEQAKKLVAAYPNTAMGVPVYYPQMPNVFVYHNRAMWPFVTAYALKAAVTADNYRVADNAIQSLVRGSALHLSNMENLEWLTGKSFYDDGPMINSRRQLWSIGAYLGMSIDTIFGVHIQDQGISIRPYVSPAVIELLGRGTEARLDNLEYRGRKISVLLKLPKVEAMAAGSYPVASILLNGKPLAGDIKWASLGKGNNLVTVSFGELNSSEQTITMADNVNPLDHSNPKVFSPEAPVAVAAELRGGKYQLSFKDGSGKADENIRYNIYKNGKQVASRIAQWQWTDSEKANTELRSCFAVEAVYMSSNHKSHHSEPYCIDGQQAQLIAVTDARVQSNLKAATDAHYAAPVLLNWGAPNDTLAVRDIKIDSPGLYALYVRYNNRQHTIDSGVTNAVKTISIFTEQGKLQQRSVVQMPNLSDEKDQYPLKNSTEIKVWLDKGSYSLALGDFFNMSYLQANSSYKGAGGATGPVNKASIAGFGLVRIE